jgi:hypothetical protein
MFVIIYITPCSSSSTLADTIGFAFAGCTLKFEQLMPHGFICFTDFRRFDADFLGRTLTVDVSKKNPAVDFRPFDFFLSSIITTVVRRPVESQHPRLTIHIHTFSYSTKNGPLSPLASCHENSKGLSGRFKYIYLNRSQMSRNEERLLALSILMMPKLLRQL